MGHAAEEIQMQGLEPEDDGLKVADYLRNLNIRAGPVLVIFVGHLEPLCQIARSLANGDEVSEKLFPECGGVTICRPNKDEDVFTKPTAWEFTPDSARAPAPGVSDKSVHVPANDLD